jgi:predicted RNA-binding protein YlqC (UPF0109 family)
MSEIDQQFIEYVVKSLVGQPDAVHIDRRIDEKGVLLELTVDPEDLGRVIGKRGATAQSLRTLLRALGTKNDARYNLKIIDNGPLDHGRAGDDNVAPPPDEPAKDSTVASDPPVTDTDAPAPAEETEESPPEEPAAPDEEPRQPKEELPAPSEDQASDRMAQTRKELADLDDLDV